MPRDRVDVTAKASAGNASSPAHVAKGISGAAGASGMAETGSSGATSEATADLAPAASGPASPEATEPVTRTTDEVAWGTDTLVGECLSVGGGEPTSTLLEAMNPADDAV